MHSSQTAEKFIHHRKQLKTDCYKDANNVNRMIADSDTYFINVVEVIQFKNSMSTQIMYETAEHNAVTYM
jgi:hypothetical protein